MATDIIVRNETELSATAETVIRDTLEAGTAENTKRAYATDLKLFWAWANERGVEQAYPVPVAIVLEYMAEHLDQYAVTTMKRKIAAISVAHRFHGVPDIQNPSRDPRVHTLLSANKRAAAKAGKVKRKSKAATSDVLEPMLATCRGNSLIDLRDKALLMVGFASGGRRRSELAGFNLADLEETPDGFILTLRHSKTDQSGDGQPLPVKGRAAQALREWITAAGITEGRLFRSIKKGGKVGISISGHAITLIVKKRAEAAGFDPAQFGGHSLRSGFVTESARRGIHPSQARALSGHKSSAVFNGYYEAGDVMNNPAGEMLGSAR